MSRNMDKPATMFMRNLRVTIFSDGGIFTLLSVSFQLTVDSPRQNLKNLPVAIRVAEQVICLPIYNDLAEWDLERIISLII